MAGNDYSLRLKATLDTSQVKQELNRLRAAQAQAAQEMGGSVKGAPMGMAHMQKIEVQLTKLNTTISGLQHAIEQLTRTQNQQLNAANTPKHSGGSMWMPPGLSKSQFGNWVSSKEYGQLNQRVRNLLMAKTSTLGGVANIGGGVYKLNDPYLAHALWGTGALKSLDPAFTKSSYRDYMTNWNQQYSVPIQDKRQRAAMRQGRQFAGLIGGQLLGGAGDIANAMGYTGLGNILGNIGAGITGGASAAMGMSLAGLGGKAAGGIGIAVGLATTITKNISSMEQLAVSVNKAAKAFDENYQVLHRQTKGIQDSILASRHETRANQLLESGNIEEAKKQADYWTKAYESTKSSFENMKSPFQTESDIREEAKRQKAQVEKYIPTNRAEDWFGTDNAAVEFLTKALGFETYGMRKQEILNEIDQDAQRQIQEMHQRYKDLEAEMNQAKDFREKYQRVVDKIESDRKSDKEKSDAEVQKRLALDERNEQNIARYQAQSALNQTQLFGQGIIDNKELSPLEKFNKIAEELDKLRISRSEKMSEAFGISKEIQGGKMTSEDMARAMAKQARIEFEASSIQNQIGVLESLLGNINTNTIAPDLSHVTSLAQYGFNMGEKNDNVERMERYYTKSINLQQRIKDKLEEGVKTEAIYN